MPPRHHVFVIAILISAGLAGCDAPPPDPRAAPLAALRPPSPETPWRWFETRLDRGDTLDAAFERLSVDAGTAAAWRSALSEVVDLRRLADGSGLRAAFDATGSAHRFEFRSDPDFWWSFERDDRTWTAVRRDVPYDETERAVSAVLDQSVAAALAEHPHGAALTVAFADVLQWDVDLFVDPRRGDRLAIVYAERSAAPGERPAFRNVDGKPRLGELLAVVYEGERAATKAFRVPGADGAHRWFDLEGRPMKKAFLKSPLNYTRISSRFSRARRHPITRRVIPHHGVDFVAPHGTPVSATGGGVVRVAGWQGALGRAVTLRHPNGYETIYGHLSRLAPGIRPGVRVEQNQIVGYVGRTGRATGNHLHYTMKANGRPIDPMRLKVPPAEPIADEDRPRLTARAGRHLPTLLEAVTGPRAQSSASTQP